MRRWVVFVPLALMTVTFGATPDVAAYAPEARFAAARTRASAPAVGLASRFAGHALLADASSAKAAKPTGFFARMKARFDNGKRGVGKLMRRVTQRPEVVTAKQAAELLKPGDRVYMQIGHGAPHEVVGELINEVARPDSRYLAAPLTIVNLSNTASRKLFSLEEGKRGQIRARSPFPGPNNRPSINAHISDAIPIHLGAIPKALREGRIPIDAAVLKVTPPDKRGFVSLGASVAVAPAAAEAARLVIGEINENVPRTRGFKMHISEFDKVLYSDKPLVPIPARSIGEVEQKIAANVIEGILKQNLPTRGLLGTFQFGIGGIPDAIAAGLVRLGRKLRVRSEMISDGVRKLAQAGLVDGKVDYTFFMGTKEGLDWLHENPKLRVHPTEAINDPAKIGKIKNFVAINGAMEVDLFGAVNAQMADHEMYSGVGGQQDFMRGAANSKGGLGIITLPSVRQRPEGLVSTISWPWPLGEDNKGLHFRDKDGKMMILRGKAPITTTSMHDLMYVVTEHGVADLAGAEYTTYGERMEALVKVADPRFRPVLKRLIEKYRQEGLDEQLAAQDAYERKKAAEAQTGAKNKLGAALMAGARKIVSRTQRQ